MFVLLGLLVFVLGVLSRTIDLQSPIFNKYLGDALYAVLFYLVLGALRPRSTIARRTLITIAFVVLVECFQLTLIPLKMRQAGDSQASCRFSWGPSFRGTTCLPTSLGSRRSLSWICEFSVSEQAIRVNADAAILLRPLGEKPWAPTPLNWGR